jgi:hypothetical protein
MVDNDDDYSKRPLYDSFYKVFTSSVDIAKAYTKIYFSSWQRLVLLLSSDE